MGITAKNTIEIGKMRNAGKILADIMRELVKNAVVGVTTDELDKLANALCKKNNVVPAFLGYNGFPKTLCVGIDDIAVHGIPAADEVLKNGQIISLDMGVIFQGFYSDHAVTIPVGNVDKQGYKLMEVTKLALNAAVSNAFAGNTTGDLGYIMEQVSRLSGFNVIRLMVGHGIGRKLHEEPEIPCFGKRGTGVTLRENMTIAIEAMVNEGTSDLVFDNDGWTTRTRDGKRSAIFEHTVVVGKKQGEILTV